MNKYKGFLSVYFETGIPASPIVQDFRGISSDKKSWDINWAYFFSNREIINSVIYKDGKEVYSGKLTFTYNEELNLIHPKEISKKDWVSYINKSYVIEIETKKELEILKNKIYIESGSYNLYLKEDFNDKKIFSGTFIGSELYFNGNIKMRFKEDDDLLFKKFYTSKSKIKTINFINKTDCYIQLQNSEIYFLEYIDK